MRLSFEEVVDALLALARDLKEACAEAKSLLETLSETCNEGLQPLRGRDWGEWHTVI